MNAVRKTMRIFGLHSQEGATLIIAVLILLVLTVVGIYAVTTSSLDTKITGYHKWHVEAFYAADAGIDYAVAQCPFETMDSLGDPDDPEEDPPSSWAGATGQPQAEVGVVYRGVTQPPPGSGTGLRAGFMAHHYQITSGGADQADIASSSVRSWGYRIGF